MEENTNTPSPTTPQALPPIPGSIISLVFGILSLVLCWYFWIPFAGIVLCIAALIFGILGMSKGKKAIALFAEKPGQFKQGSLSLAKTGKILGLVGLILNAIFLIIAIIISIIGGSYMSM
jgi:hypothetical protein